MKQIIYRFCDGTKNTVDVTYEVYEIHKEIEQMEKRNHWKETRRHISMTVFNDNGIEFEDPDSDIVENIIKEEEEQKLKYAISQLLPQQQDLIEKIFYSGKTITEIAKDEGVSKPAILDRLSKIYKKMKRFL
ncbi:MAG: sigma-70 family RNA polymerase sigma factor [Christensenellaceae bacterium]|jgi:RNA polymerase sigma-70 factor (ECF subfamily)|nr:sigma-70 family RNA polymerase sigma factor [Christensenellaceae bacterium]